MPSMILSESRVLRLFTVFLLYVCQGIPIGLFWFAVPAWMAANGAGNEEVGTVLGLTALPWTLKLVNGFIMDRYTFLPMGRRRVWLIGAQAVMVLALFGCAAVSPTSTDTLLLGAAGFIVNMATTFQDVAVDGLAVDIMEEDERARASGMMFGGQAIGIGAGAAVTGGLMAGFGPAAAYLATAAMIGAVTLYVLVLRERPDERLLPWSKGVAHERNLAIKLDAWWPILKTTFQSMLHPISLLWLPVLFVRGIFYGMGTGLTSLIGTGSVGWDEGTITATVGVAQLVAGILGLTLAGWAGDRYGAKPTTILMFGVMLTFDGTMWLLYSAWGDPSVFIAFVYTWITIDVLITVVALPISMRLCDARVAATQFTLYMAMNNFGISCAAWILGFADSLGGLRTMFLIMLALHGLGLLLMLTVAYPRRQKVLQDVAAELPQGRGLQPQID